MDGVIQQRLKSSKLAIPNPNRKRGDEFSGGERERRRCYGIDELKFIIGSQSEIHQISINLPITLRALMKAGGTQPLDENCGRKTGKNRDLERQSKPL